jgi:hypothetical protein
MSSLATQNHSQTDVIALSMSEDAYLQLLKQPLRALPMESREHVYRLWMAHRYLKDLDNSLPIVTALAVFAHDYGLDPKHIPAICHRLNHPMAVARHKYTSDLMTELAQAAAEFIESDRKRAKAEQEKREREEENRQAAEFRASGGDGFCLTDAAKSMFAEVNQ